MLHAVAPESELSLAHARTVHNRYLAEANPRIAHGLDLDLLAKAHAIGFQLHVLEDGAAENPHAGLRVAHPAEKEKGHGQRESEVANLIDQAHAVPVAHRETRGVK